MSYLVEYWPVWWLLVAVAIAVLIHRGEQRTHRARRSLDAQRARAEIRIQAGGGFRVVGGERRDPRARLQESIAVRNGRPRGGCDTVLPVRRHGGES